MVSAFLGFTSWWKHCKCIGEYNFTQYILKRTNHKRLQGTNFIADKTGCVCNNWNDVVNKLNEENIEKSCVKVSYFNNVCKMMVILYINLMKH